MAYALLAIAWIFGDPPGAGPDEPSNYVKAVAIGRGEFLGRPGALPAQQALAFGLTGARYDWTNATTRWVSIPPSLAPLGFGCNAFRATQSAACVNAAVPPPVTSEQPTYAGTYEPFVYLLPGLLARFSQSAPAALLLMRSANALLCLVLLALAIWLISAGGRTRLALMGLLVALTPELVWLTAIVNASGPEVCGGLCFFAAILRLARPQAPTRGVWLALITSGAILGLSRPLGAVWLALDLALLTLIAGPVPLWGRLRAGGRFSAAAVVVVFSVVGVSAGWEVAVEPRNHVSLPQFFSQLPQAIVLLPEYVREGVGVFGWLDTYLPARTYLLWAFAVVALMLVALMVGTRRQRLTLVIVLVLTMTVTLSVAAAILGPNGFQLQARHVMAFAVVVPLYAGEVIYLNANRLSHIWPAYMMGGIVSLMSALQGVAWFVNAHREAVGTLGPAAFWLRSEWTPPLGWLPWSAAVAAGCLTLMGAAISTRPARRLPRHAANRRLAA